MFVEHKEALEVTEAPAKTLKLSEAIRKGCSDTRPIRSSVFFRWNDVSCCALGAALVGFAGNIEQAHKLWISEGGVCAALKQFGITRKLQTLASERYESGNESREEIADWLEKQGY